MEVVASADAIPRSLSHDQPASQATQPSNSANTYTHTFLVLNVSLSLHKLKHPPHRTAQHRSTRFMRLPSHLTVLITALAGLSYTAAGAARGTRYPIHTRIIAPSSSSSSADQQPPPPPFRQTGTIEIDVDVSTFAVALDGNGEVVLPSARYVPLQDQQGGQAGGPKEGQEGQVEGKEEESVMMRDDVWLQVAVEVQGLEENLWPRSVVRAVSTVPCCVGLSFSCRPLSHRSENQDARAIRCVGGWIIPVPGKKRGKGTTCSVFSRMTV